MKKFAPIVLRYGLALVLAWFGYQQLTGPGMWVGFLPDFTNSLPISQTVLVQINGWLEIICAVLLIGGVYIRVVAFIMAVHLVGIVISVGYGPIGARDFGLTLALVSIFLQGRDDWSLDYILDDKKSLSQEML